MQRVLIACSVVGLGCGQVAGIDEYTVAEDEAVVPYLDGAECRACLAAECGDKLNDCESDDLCRDTLACRRKCEDPSCHFNCAYPKSDDRAWNQLVPLALPQPANDDVHVCAADHCRTECSIGRSWACAGRYDWDYAPPGDLTIRHRVFVKDVPVVGANVRVCSRIDFDCLTDLAEGPLPHLTDEYGGVELTVPDATLDLYLKMEAFADYPPLLIFGKQKPRLTNTYSANGMTTRTVLETALQSINSTFDEARAYFHPQFFDCAGYWADDLVVDLLVRDGGELRPCEDCFQFYFESSVPSLTATHTLTGRQAKALVWFTGVEPAPVLLQAHDRSGKLVARAEVVLRPGSVHQLGAQALTRALAHAE